MRADPISGQRWWVIGASTGLGRAIALELAAAGATVIASARSTQALEALAREVPAITALPMDVTSDVSVEAASARAGSPFGIVYAAGAYEPMSAQDWLPEQAETMAEVNFVGALRVLSHLIPKQLEKGAGRVVLIGSLAGFRGLPGAIGYGASKAALMQLAENLRADLRGSGVKPQIIKPGFIRTRLTAKNAFAMPQIMEPGAAAERVLAAIRAGRFSTSFPAPFAWLFTLGQHLPLALFQAVFGRTPSRSADSESRQKRSRPMKPPQGHATDLTVFYDGACPLCRAEIAFYGSQEGVEAMTFIDVARAQNPLPQGVSRAAALARFHVETADGQVIDGAGAFLALLRRLPRFRWLARIGNLPLLRPLLSLLYAAFLSLRPAIVRLYCRLARVRDV